MPLSVIIEKDLVESINESYVKDVKGLWINADVRVFIPLDVLSQVKSDEEVEYVSQNEAQALFIKLENLKKVNPTVFGDWEISFLESLTAWFDTGKMFSKKQKAKIKSMAVNYSELLDAETVDMRAVEDSIPF